MNNMSQRIADTLEVLDLIRDFSIEQPYSSFKDLRIRAINHVASRGVDKRTVYAHLVGKDTFQTLSADDINFHLEQWITNVSTDFENWLIKSCNNVTDEKRVRHFFKTKSSTPVANDINEVDEARRSFISTYRILRDTALARRMKGDNNFTCQLCGTQIVLNDGTPYAEAHHVQPLGNPHNGPDHPGNIVCVCPNCHVKLDYGVIYIKVEDFEDLHPIYLKYHNDNIYMSKV